MTAMNSATIDLAPASAPDLDVEVRRIDDIGALEGPWTALEARGDGSFFQSWGWIGTWLAQLPAGVAPQVIAVRAGARVVGLGILVGRRTIRRGWIWSNSLYLNETGDPELDRLTMEYNGLVADPEYRDAVASHVFAWLAERRPGWDEIYLSGIGPENVARCRTAAEGAGLRVWTRDCKRFDFVDLTIVRAAGGDYMAALSRNSRYQLRRAIRRYEERGPLVHETARTAGQATEFFDGLKELHQAHWIAHGHPGAFSSDFFERFHRALIAARFAAGEIQLSRVSAGGEAIGYLYNFANSGRVYAYQSGFRYEKDSKLKPGLICHYLAIQHSIEAGARVYDFMAGEGQHKQSLGNAWSEMVWLVVQRPRARFRLEHALRALKRRLGR